MGARVLEAAVTPGQNSIGVGNVEGKGKETCNSVKGGDWVNDRGWPVRLAAGAPAATSTPT